MHRAEIEDTYAEAFRSIYAEVLITARDRVWLDHAVNAAPTAPHDIFMDKIITEKAVYEGKGRNPKAE